MKRATAVMWFQYILIYLLITQVGGFAVAILGGNDMFLYICFAMSIIGYFCIGRRVDASYNIFIAVLFICLLFNVLRSESGLSIGTTVTLITKYLLLYATVKIDSSNFLPRFLKLSYILICASLVLFAIMTVLGAGVVLPIYSRLWRSDMRMGGFFTSIVTTHFGRNCGIFGEPGQYQAFLTTVLYFVLFHTDRYNSSQYKIKYTAATILGIMTCQSTSGFIGMIGIILIYIFLYGGRNDEDTKYKYLLVSFMILGSIMMMFVDKDSYFYYNLIGKIMGPDGLDFQQHSSGARIDSLMGVIDVLKKDSSAIWGIGYDAIRILKLDGCASIPVLLLAIGLPAFILIYGFMFVVGFIYRKNFGDFIVRAFLVINVGLGQPNILFITFLLMMFYGLLMKNEDLYPYDLEMEIYN